MHTASRVSGSHSHKEAETILEPTHTQKLEATTGTHTDTEEQCNRNPLTQRSRSFSTSQEARSHSSYKLNCEKQENNSSIDMQSKFHTLILAICLMSVALSEAMSVPRMYTPRMVKSRMGMELRCQCIKTESNFIHPHNIQIVELYPSGAQCANVEVIATLKDGQRVCLDPSAPWVRKIIQKISESSPDINNESQ
ncbi:platelet basic protein [Microcaecilia unicolor]|uniref:Platelet basic protein-like n=1 Tax=Microcaecilia unicolor TaxID=1415580 RepID=A0A6P7X3P5_9AMPH|nr:platelet basic protein-like [Microcaecilia unicolor]